MDEPLDPPEEADRLASVQLARNSARELMLTFILLFGVTSIVRWVIGPSPISRLIPQIHFAAISRCYSTATRSRSISTSISCRACCTGATAAIRRAATRSTARRSTPA